MLSKVFVKNQKETETLVLTTKIYSQDVGMEFSIEKCAMLIMRKKDSGKNRTAKYGKH